MSRRLSRRERAGYTSPFQDHQNSVVGRLPSVQDPAASGVIQPRTTKSGRSWFLQSRPGSISPTRTAGIRLFPDQKLDRGRGRVRDCFGCWVSGGSGCWVSGSRGQNRGRSACWVSGDTMVPTSWVQEEIKGYFVYVLKFVLTYFNVKLMWSLS
jgi:hypothetical protein